MHSNLLALEAFAISDAWSDVKQTIPKPPVLSMFQNSSLPFLALILTTTLVLGCGEYIKPTHNEIADVVAAGVGVGTASATGIAQIFASSVLHRRT